MSPFFKDSPSRKFKLPSELSTPPKVENSGTLTERAARQRAIEESLFKKEQPKDRLSVKGRFLVELPTSAGQWCRDMDWKGRANPIAKAEEDRRTKWDLKMLEKHRNQRLLKNASIEQDMRVKDARIKLNYD